MESNVLLYISDQKDDNKCDIGSYLGSLLSDLCSHIPAVGNSLLHVGCQALRRFQTQQTRDIQRDHHPHCLLSLALLQ